MTENKPFFSVIVPAYNSAAFIRKGLDSIRDQSFKDYELIVICDRCEDDTAQICREYTDKVTEVDFGSSGSSLNVGLDMARGEWVLFMDDDDHFLHEFAFGMLADMIRSLPADREIDILAFSFIWRGIGYAQNTPKKHFPAYWNKCWRREFIGGTRFPDWQYSADYGFARKLHWKAKWVYWDMPFYYYNYMRPGCVSEKIKNGEYEDMEMPKELEDAAKEYKRFLSEQ